ncbi:MAG: hypothetical protein ABI967_08230 [bacterium]
MPRRRTRKKGDTAQLAAQLAPLEELNQQGASKQLSTSNPHLGGTADPHYGAIVVDNTSLNLPKDFAESRNERLWKIEPVVLVILIVMLAWIAFVAWQISHMSAQ